MNINIIGDGSFGTFLKKELPNYGFKLDDLAETVILAVPFSAYENLAEKLIKSSFGSPKPHSHFINVCSVQKPSTDILLKYTDKVTSIHPLFGARTPADKRNSILTYLYAPNYHGIDDEARFLELFANFSNIHPKIIDPESHDKLMAKIHIPPILAAKQIQHFIDAATDIPDELLPNSFRLMKQFCKTMEDCPPGTIESIMANPYI